MTRREDSHENKSARKLVWGRETQWFFEKFTKTNSSHLSVQENPMNSDKNDVKNWKQMYQLSLWVWEMTCPTRLCAFRAQNNFYAPSAPNFLRALRAFRAQIFWWVYFFKTKFLNFSVFVLSSNNPYPYPYFQSLKNAHIVDYQGSNWLYASSGVTLSDKISADKTGEISTWCRKFFSTENFVRRNFVR